MEILKKSATFYVICFAAGVLLSFTRSHFQYVAVTLLGIMLLLLWEQLYWLKSLADTLGCVPARKRRIKELFKKYDRSEFARPEKQITEAEKEELKELTEVEYHAEPAKTAQLLRMIDLLFSDKEYRRPETQQLERIIELLTEIKANGLSK